MAVDPKRVQEVFLAASDTEDPVQRAAILDRECTAEPELRSRVEELLMADASPDSIVDGPSPLVASPPSSATVALEPSTDPQAFSKTSSITSAGLNGDDEESRLDFLQASTKPGSIGRLGHYEILQVIGKGGFGTVLKAFDEKLHRVVAIKVLSPELAASATARNRFIREARAAAAVTHDHVVTIHVVDEDHRPPYLVMQLIDGVTLQQKLDKVGALSLKEILRIGLQVAEGLAAAHKQGLVHRDIKPANILLENGIERVKITDFGLARAVDDASVTQSGTVAGTPLYMSPEQANGLTLDHRSDLFSLGTVLYVMCTGRPPFRASGTMAVLKRVIDDMPRPVREINHEIPDWLCDIISKLHAKKPEDRFQTAKEVADLLGQHLANVQAGRAIERRAEGRQTPVEPSNGPLTQHRSPAKRGIAAALPWLGGGVAIALIILAVAIANWWERPHPVAGNGIAGEWGSNFGWVTIEHGPIEGKLPVAVTGFYVQGANKAIITKGTFDPATGRLRFDYSEPWLGLTGSADLKLSKDGTKLDGTWINSIDGSGVWTMVRKNLVPPPTPDVKTGESGWVQLFNGKNLSGWKLFPADKDVWTVKDGILIGQGAECSMLPSERGDFRDFHLRVEAKINEGGDSGVWFRTDLKSQDGYEANINHSHRDPARTGSLGIKKNSTQKWLHHQNNSPAPANTWFTLEIIATGSTMTVRVDGVTVAQVTDANRSSGHIGLEMFEKGSVAQFRKIEIKELPPTTPLPLAVAPFDAKKAKEHQDAWAKHLGIEPEITNSIGMKLRLIPPGEFTMGSSPTEIEWLITEAPDLKNAENWIKEIVRGEGPERRVTIREPFLIGAYEVTVGQFREFVQAKKYVTEAEMTGGGLIWNNQVKTWEKEPGNVWNSPKLSGSENHPVVFVTPVDARAFCAWLSAKEGRKYALPAEEQWEYACRAGTTTRWYFGDDPAAMKAHGWTVPHSEAKHQPVGRLASNPFGLYDMYGNATEFTVTPQDQIIDRGGQSGETAQRARSAWRLPIEKITETHAHRGFRVVLVGDLKVKTPPAESWAPLFNGKNLDGWKTHLEQPGTWNVQAGELVGSTGGAPISHLYSTRGDFADFHLRAEVKINKDGFGGIHFRCTPSPEFDLNAFKGRGKQPLGYLANIIAKPVASHPAGTGSIWRYDTKDKAIHKAGTDVPITEDTWFLLEIVTRGNHIVTKVNGKIVEEFRDAAGGRTKGHFALNANYPQTKVHFKKIEIKELPPTASPPLALAPFNADKAKEHQDAWAKHLSVEPEITNTIGMKLRLIPPGEFLMGTPANDLLALLEEARKTKALDLEITRIAKEGAQHPVRLTQPYYIGTFEVTRAQFTRFVQSTGHKTDIERNGKGGWSNHKGEWVRRPEHVWSTPGEWQTHDDEPVVQVTWNDAKSFCDWLSETEGRSYVLPTEAQWEFACRAGTTNLTHAEPGRPLKEYAWTSETLLPDRATHHPKPVGLKKQNAFGLHDMLGNVWEHCSDWYEPGPTDADLQIDPVGPKTGFARSIRGGAWYREGSIFARCGARSYGLVIGKDSEGSDAGIGFRVAIVGDLKARTNPATSWAQLFNGKDLTGWKANLPDKWKVENGAIVGHGNSYLALTDKTFENLHCRLEAKINADGWGGLAIRNTGESHGNISICPERGKTGSLFFFNKGKNQLLRQPEKQLASPDTWLTLEVIVQGKNVVVLVNGTKTAEATIDGLPDRGPIFLNADAPGTVIHFRKIEIKELPATPK